MTGPFATEPAATEGDAATWQPTADAAPPGTRSSGPDAGRARDADTPLASRCDMAHCDPEEATCDVVGGTAICTCKPGYHDVHGDGQQCEGIDECQNGQASCAANATCLNTPAGYLCQCDRGFHGDGRTGCEPNLACSQGQVPDPCGDSGYCHRQGGGPEGLCACGDGREFDDALACRDVDECARGLHDCHGLAQCDNGHHPYECHCPDGHLGDGHGDAGCFVPASTLTQPRIPGAGDQPCPTFEVGLSTPAGLLGATVLAGPKSDTPNAPLLLYWHGTGSGASEALQLLPAAMQQEIQDAGGILVAFEGTTGSGGDCSGTGTFARDDFALADHIVACAVRDHNIDPRRIYVTGCASGGLQAGCMAVARSEYVAAVVTNSGGIVGRHAMQAAHAPGVMTMYETTGTTIIEFRQTSRALTDQVRAFQGEAVDCGHARGQCRPPEELYLAGWAFMKAHPIGAGDSVYQAGLPAGFPSYCTRR